MATAPHILAPYIRAGYPAIAIETYESDRLISETLASFDKRPVFSYAATGGLRDERANKASTNTNGFPAAFAYAASKPEQIVFIMDFQHMVSSPAAYRPLIQALAACKAQGSIIVLVAPTWKLPEELKHELPVLQMPLPDTDALRAPLQIVREATGLSGEESGFYKESALTSAARGLTIAEAENAFALAATRQTIDHAIVEGEKMRLVRSQCMSVEKPTTPEALAGLGQLKEYVTLEVLPGKDDAELFVRGILLIGIPGTGKSLTAKVIASLMQWPLLRLDVGAAKGSLVGQSEGNLRHALQTADAIAPCVLWLDEIEKAVGGHASSANTDGGTTLGMVGTLLTWMQEHTTPVIVVATCNDYAKLPPELTRAGRFDERFFLDLPTEGERRAIAGVHLKRFTGMKNVSPLDSDIASLTENWTGAEIEQLVRSAARRTKRNITAAAISDAATSIIPISKHGDIQKLRTWAQDHLRPANDAAAVATIGRRIAK